MFRLSFPFRLFREIYRSIPIVSFSIDSFPIETYGSMNIIEVCKHLHCFTTSRFSKFLNMLLQEKGFIPKVNSLEEILRSSSKMEPKLIGYDEVPLDTINLGPEFSGADLDPCREVGNSHSVCITRISETPVSSSGAAEDLKPSMAFGGHDSSTDLQSSSGWFLKGYYYVSSYFLMHSGLFRSVG